MKKPSSPKFNAHPYTAAAFDNATRSIHSGSPSTRSPKLLSTCAPLPLNSRGTLAFAKTKLSLSPAYIYMHTKAAQSIVGSAEKLPARRSRDAVYIPRLPTPCAAARTRNSTATFQRASERVRAENARG